MHVNNLQSVGALGAFSRVLKTSENLECSSLVWTESSLGWRWPSTTSPSTCQPSPSCSAASSPTASSIVRIKIKIKTNRINARFVHLNKQTSVKYVGHTSDFILTFYSLKVTQPTGWETGLDSSGVRATRELGPV